MARVALVSHPACLAHDPGPWHPERPARLEAVISALSAPVFSDLQRYDAPVATDQMVKLVHLPDYLQTLRRLNNGGERVELDPDTVLMPASLEAALRAVGGGVLAVDLVLSGRVDRAFVAVRPPGHHAEAGYAMGFCLFNSAAIAASYAQQHHGLARIVLVDFDVHHGNGSQSRCADAAGLLYVSSHQHPCFPGTGLAEETGGGHLVNMPLAPGSGSAAFRQAWTDIGLPAITAFRPSLMVISAGFDAHQDDPLAQIALRIDDFAWLTRSLVAAATSCEGRIVSLLEGGYDLRALSAGVAAHVTALMQG